MGPAGVAGRALVTGSTGFLGRAIVEELVASGRPVRALVRSDAAAKTLAALGAEPVRGDVLDRPALDAGLAGCEVVYHAAGGTGVDSPEAGEMVAASFSPLALLSLGLLA